uniref:Uncharacterized protein n=1 Tax=Coccidioides posadasii RMSCC 3488 TaxID=454284 RepID=A0A0J6FG74_COCPO|nr:hypothetical protein CPAG_05609 [Coccidioides posadasii RMSCC 3488]
MREAQVAREDQESTVLDLSKVSAGAAVQQFQSLDASRQDRGGGKLLVPRHSLTSDMIGRIMVSGARMGPVFIFLSPLCNPGKLQGGSPRSTNKGALNYERRSSQPHLLANHAVSPPVGPLQRSGTGIQTFAPHSFFVLDSLSNTPGLDDWCKKRTSSYERAASKEDLFGPNRSREAISMLNEFARCIVMVGIN